MNKRPIHYFLPMLTLGLAVIASSPAQASECYNVVYNVVGSGVNAKKSIIASTWTPSCKITMQTISVTTPKVDFWTNQATVDMRVVASSSAITSATTFFVAFGGKAHGDVKAYINNLTPCGGPYLCAQGTKLQIIGQVNNDILTGPYAGWVMVQQRDDLAK